MTLRTQARKCPKVKTQSVAKRCKVSQSQNPLQIMTLHDRNPLFRSSFGFLRLPAKIGVFLRKPALCDLHIQFPSHIINVGNGNSRLVTKFQNI